MQLLNGQRIDNYFHHLYQWYQPKHCLHTARNPQKYAIYRWSTDWPQSESYGYGWYSCFDTLYIR